MRLRRRLRWICALVAVTWLTAGCIEVNRSFRCAADSDCLRGGQQGLCSLDRCAFQDTSCPSGYSYGELSEDVAATCVPVPEAAPVDATPDGPLPVGPTFISVSAGDTHTCAIGLDESDTRQLWCWGANESGQLGTGDTEPSDVPVLIDLMDVRQIAAGGKHTCATVGAGRTVYCWGNNALGQVGVGANVDDDTGPAVENAPKAVALSALLLAAGTDHTCAIDLGNDIYCWGSNAAGQLGIGDPAHTPSYAPDVVGASTGGPSWISVGTAHSCYMNTARKVFCWGSNDLGQLGTVGVSQDAPIQNDFTGAGTAGRVSCGENGCCASDSNPPKLECWGDNSFYQLTETTPEFSATPLNAGLGTPGFLAAGGSHVCATDGLFLNCWGKNDYGQVGASSATARVDVPHALQLQLDQALDASISKSFDKNLALGADHTCAISAGTVHCWGRNQAGQLGLGDAADRDTPTPVSTLQ